MSHKAFLVKWDEFLKTLEETGHYDDALESAQSFNPEPLDDSDNVTFYKTWTRLRDAADPPWIVDFEHVFAFEFNPDKVKSPYEQPHQHWVVSQLTPEEVGLRQQVLKKIRFKPLLPELPKKLRNRCLALAEYVNQWRKIFNEATEKKLGMVICFNWDH